MFKNSYISDKLAMSLSAICVIHCFFAPALLIFSVGISVFSIDSELVHYVILMLALPISSLALIMGYRNHKTVYFLITGILGLSILMLAVITGERLFGEIGEQVMTLIGSMLVAYSHFKNYRTCQELECSCHDS